MKNNRDSGPVNKHSAGYDYSIIELNEKIFQLEKELLYTKQCLHSLQDEFVAYSEPVQSNTELQAVNDALYKVKDIDQFQNKEIDILSHDMENFLNNTEIATIFLDRDLCIRNFTAGISKELNVIKRDIGRPMRGITHNFISDEINKAAEEAALGNKVEREIQSKTGNWFLLKCAPYYLSDQEIDGVVLSLVDITRSKNAESDLLYNTKKLDQIIESSPYSIYIIQDGKFLFANAEGLKLLHLNNLQEIKDYRHYFNIEEKYLLGDTLLPKEDNIILPDGTSLFVEISAISHMVDRKAAKLIFVRDATYRLQELRLAEENENNIKLLREKIISENLMKEFFGTLSHELRTPLNVIFNALQLLDATISNGDIADSEIKIKKFSKIMKQNCYRQMKLVNNMIDVTKLDTGFFNLDLKNNDIVHIIKSVTHSVSEYLSSKAVELTFETTVETCNISCDAEKIERVLLNLLSNALKFTDAGGRIMVAMSTQGEQVIISIKDTGIGIPADKLDMVFERFRQVDKSSTRNQEGIGLGLSIVKSLVELHEGKISVSSVYGIGTEFIIILPIKLLPEDEVENILIDIDLDNRLEKISTEFSDILN